MSNLEQYAIMLDNQYTKIQAACKAHKAEQEKKKEDCCAGRNNTTDGGGGGGRNTDHPPRNNCQNDGDGGRGDPCTNNSQGDSPRDYIPYNKWQSMSWEARAEHIRFCSNQQSANTTNQQTSTGGGQNNGRPSTLHVGTTTSNATTPTIMSLASARSTTSNNDEMSINGLTYRQVNMARTHYCVSQQEQHASTRGALVDGGANGGLFGTNIHILEYVEGAHVDISGVGTDNITNLKLYQGATLVTTVDDGPVVIIVSQYADYG